MQNRAVYETTATADAVLSAAAFWFSREGLRTERVTSSSLIVRPRFERNVALGLGLMLTALFGLGIIWIIAVMIFGKFWKVQVLVTDADEGWQRIEIAWADMPQRHVERFLDDLERVSQIPLYVSLAGPGGQRVLRHVARAEGVPGTADPSVGQEVTSGGQPTAQTQSPAAGMPSTTERSTNVATREVVSSFVPPSSEAPKETQPAVAGQSGTKRAGRNPWEAPVLWLAVISLVSFGMAFAVVEWRGASGPPGPPGPPGPQGPPGPSGSVAEAPLSAQASPSPFAPSQPPSGAAGSYSGPYKFSGNNKTITEDFCVTANKLIVDYSASGIGRFPDIYHLTIRLNDREGRYGEFVDSAFGLEGSGRFNLKTNGAGCSYYLEVDPFDAAWEITISQ